MPSSKILQFPSSPALPLGGLRGAGRRPPWLPLVVQVALPHLDLLPGDVVTVSMRRTGGELHCTRERMPAGERNIGGITAEQVRDRTIEFLRHLRSCGLFHAWTVQPGAFRVAEGSGMFGAVEWPDMSPKDVLQWYTAEAARRETHNA